VTNPSSNPPSANYWSPGSTNNGLLHLELDQVAKACEQLAPERARSCRNAITMSQVMVDEIRLRARARPLGEPER
jgi:hypothetical protein